MDTMSIILIIVVIALLVFFMNRSRTIARGSNRPTYDDQARAQVATALPLLLVNLVLMAWLVFR